MARFIVTHRMSAGSQDEFVARAKQVAASPVGGGTVVELVVGGGGGEAAVRVGGVRCRSGAGLTGAGTGSVSHRDDQRGGVDKSAVVSVEL